MKKIEKKENVVVNVNTATVEELQTVKGVGEKMAEKIVEKRTEIGSFKSILDLSQVKGLGPEGTMGKKLSGFVGNFTFGEVVEEKEKEEDADEDLDEDDADEEDDEDDSDEDDEDDDDE